MKRTVIKIRRMTCVPCLFVHPYIWPTVLGKTDHDTTSHLHTERGSSTHHHRWQRDSNCLPESESIFSPSAHRVSVPSFECHFATVPNWLIDWLHSFCYNTPTYITKPKRNNRDRLQWDISSGYFSFVFTTTWSLSTLLARLGLLLWTLELHFLWIIWNTIQTEG